MEIYLIRHTTPDIAKGICYGQTDIGLSDTFPAEVVQIKKQLGFKPERIYSSPASRCVHLAETFSVPPEVDNRLLELNFGEWEMRSWDEIDRNALDIWMKDFVTQPCPGGESYCMLYYRVTSFLNELINTGKTAVIITHAGVIRAMLSHVLDMPLERSFEIKITYGQIVKLFVNDNLTANRLPKIATQKR